MTLAGVWVSLVVAAVDWVAVARQWKWLEFFAKPAVMVVLLAWLALRAAAAPAWPAPLLAFALGLLFSLLGDVFLMLPSRFFLAGLVAFLLGHVAYVVGFNLTGGLPVLGALLLAVPVGVAAVWLARRVTAALAATGKGALRGPVVAYTAIISLMVISALATLLRPDWPLAAAMLASLGALLFMLSDSVLAWNRFVSPVRHGPLLVIVSYHLGQMGLIAGAATRFLGG